MKYKPGDKFVCKFNSTLTDITPGLEKGKVYKIQAYYIYLGFYIIENSIFYSHEEIVIQGISPSNSLTDFFYTPKELRKKKLDTIENNRQ